MWRKSRHDRNIPWYSWYQKQTSKSNLQIPFSDVRSLLYQISSVKNLYYFQYYLLWLSSLHGKTFQKIRQMLPDKPISALVKYYYCWKKLRFKSSQLDKQAKKTSDENKKMNG